jgi:hypothetical protein
VGVGGLVGTSRIPTSIYPNETPPSVAEKLYHKYKSGRMSLRVTKPCVAFSIAIDNLGDAFLTPLINCPNHVGEMRRYSAISAFAPLGSVIKYSSNVILRSSVVFILI